MDFSKELLSFISTPDSNTTVPQTTTLDQPKGGSSGLTIDKSITDFIYSPAGVQEPHSSIKKVDYQAEADRLMSSLVFTESNGIHREKDGTLRVSEKGARGLTQIMPHTGAKPGYNVRPLQNQSVQEYYRVGRDYLAAMMTHFEDVEKGVAAYNAGPGRLQGILSKAERTGRNWKEFLPKETQEYIKKVR